MEISFEQATAFVATLVWPFMRISAMLMAMPIIGTRLLPTRIKIVTSVVIAFMVVPLLPPVPAVEPLIVKWTGDLCAADFNWCRNGI